MSPLVKTWSREWTKKIDVNKKYEECVQTLNSLQSNEQILEKIQQARDKMHLYTLKVIHVSGTKGKGSTCAYCESILRHQGFKTGFYSSPHLVEVRERIRVNGQPLSRDKFVFYFWDVFNKLEATKEQNNGSMPAYFAFLTLMAYYTFLHEETDVAIIEVGIGGQYDYTNMVRTPVVCGVTSLGIDHVSNLGNTIEKIAWHKAGIFKYGVPAYTSPQCPEALKVLYERAKEKECHLQVVPDFNSYHRPGEKFKLGIAGKMQKVNASLALQLTRTWMETQGAIKEETLNGANAEAVKGHVNIEAAKSFPLMQSMIDGLVQCKWLCRNQTIKKNKLTYYLDGAHTLESIQTTHDTTNMNFSMETQLKKCQHIMETWKELSRSNRKNIEIEEVNTEVQNGMTKSGLTADCNLYNLSSGHCQSLDNVDQSKQNDYTASSSSSRGTDSTDDCTQKQLATDFDSFVVKFPCIYDALLWASPGRDQNLKDACNVPAQVHGADHVQILVTGGMHLVGGVLGIVSDDYK
ncbi:FPGS [Mytilus edulis]|uniref:FPGS n=1 Tax=Mytilus edulis TaxID=6550 RepID=A0A8S3U302_MYTED|nr:FPGS [Mytilus edulis]